MQLAQSFGIASVAAATSFTTSVIIIKSKRWHGRFSLDSDLSGVQKFHKKAVPRIGGIAVVTGIFIALLTCIFTDSSFAQKFYARETFLLTVAGMPAFIAGTIEDLTKKVSVRTRLTATFTSAILAFFLVGSVLDRVDFWGVDYLLAYLPFAIVFTAFVVAGGTNAINIIDGFHGVAGGAIIIMLGAFAYLGWQSGDRFRAGPIWLDRILRILSGSLRYKGYPRCRSCSLSRARACGAVSNLIHRLRSQF